jgi:hypothetical protein
MSLSGLKLGVTPWLFPYLGAWLSTLLFIYVTGLSIHETNLRILVIELYKSVNYEHESMNKARTTPYALPSIADVMTASVSDSSSCLETLLAVLNAFIGNIILIVSPIASVILAGYKMTLIFGRVWWVLTSLSLLLFGIIGYFAIDIRNHLKFSKYMRQA